MSVEAEVAILGAILLDNAHYQEAAGYRKPPTHPLIRTAASLPLWPRLLGQGKAVDIVTLAEERKPIKQIAAIGGVAYLASLTEGLPHRISIDGYVLIVKDKFLLRQTIGVATGVAAAASDQTDSTVDVLADAESAFRRIADQSITAGLESVA